MNAEPEPSLRRQLWWALPLLALVWLKELAFPERVAAPLLDDSWHAIKGWELLHQPRLGVESVFTYGPLGWFHSACHIHELYYWKLIFWECGVKLVLCALCVLAVVRARGWFQRLCFGLALAWMGSGPDAFAFVSYVAILSWTLARPERSAKSEIPVLLAAALLAEVKFTYFAVYALGALIACAGMWSASGRPRALQFLGRAALTFVLSWIAAGQALIDLPRYIRTSGWIASGYNDGMSWFGPHAETLLALAMIGASVLVVAIELWRGPRTGRHVALGLIVLLCAWAAYKSGLTRHFGNASLFFSSAPVMTWFLLARPARAGRLDLGLTVLQRALQAGLLLAGTRGFLQSLGSPDPELIHYLRMMKQELTIRSVTLAHVGSLRQTLDEESARAHQAFRLPRIAERVGRETVDVFGSTQAIAFLNDFEYRPRPVFQSYSVYTPELLALNREFYEGPRAPRFVLYRQDGIDMRLSVHDDCKAFETLLTHYEPLFSERAYLLLERLQTPRVVPAPELVHEQDLALGEWLELADLPGKVLLLELDAQRSLRGDLLAFGLGGPLLHAALEQPGGSVTMARILPRIASEGILVRPQIENQDHALGLFCGEERPGVKRLRFVVPEGKAKYWKSPFHVRILRRDGLLPAPRPELIEATRYAMFAPAPQKVVCAHPFGPLDVGNQVVGLCHAPSSLIWDLEPGPFALQTDFGIVDSAWAGAGCTDGAVFQILLVPDNGKPRTLFERRLDPANAQADRGPQKTQLEFDAEVHSRLVLRIDVGPAGNPACDWTWWGGFSLKRR